MGKSHGKLVIHSDHSNQSKSNKESTNGGPSRNSTEVIKGNGDKDVPHIDDVVEGDAVNPSGDDVDNRATTAEGAGSDKVKRGHSDKKKKTFKWSSRGHSRKSETQKEHEETKEPKPTKETKEPEESKEPEAKDAAPSAGDAAVQGGLFEEVMTSAVVAHADETPVTSCQLDTIPVEDIPRCSVTSEQDDTAKVKRHVEIIHMMPPSSDEKQGSDEDVDHTTHEPKSDASEEGQDDLHASRDDDRDDENYIPVDTNNTNVDSEEIVNGVHSEASTDEENGVQEETVTGEAEEEKVVKEARISKLPDLDLTNGSEHEATAPSLDHETELSSEPVI